MSGLIDIQTISIGMASAGVFLAAIYYIFQIRHQTRIRKTDLVMRLYSTLSSKEFEEAWYRVYNLEFRDYDDFLKKYGSFTTETPTNLAFSIVFDFFEGVGVLLHKRLADIDLIYDLFGERVTTTWEKSKPSSEGLKKHCEKEMPIVKKPSSDLNTSTMKSRKESNDNRCSFYQSLPPQAIRTQNPVIFH